MPNEFRSNPNNERVILWLCYLAAAIVLMDLTSVNIALPTIRDYFGFGITQVSWLLMASMLSATSFAIIAGRIIDNYDVRTILSIGFLIFMVGTMASFLVSQFEVLLVIRFVQGFGEAFLYVVGPAFIRKNLPLDKQHGAYGIWMASTAVGISFGPVLGGLMVSEFSWNGVFLINFILSASGIIVLLFYGLFKLEGIKKVVNADYVGAVYSFITLASSIMVLHLAHEKGFFDLRTLISFMLAALFLFLFLQREKTFINPIFDFKLFTVRNFNLAALGFFIFFVVNVGSRFLRPFYFENIKLFSPQTSGMLMMVSPLVMLFVSPLSRMISKRFNPQIVIITANLLLAYSMFWFSRWGLATSIWELVLAMILLGLAMGLYYPVNSFVGMNNLSPQQSGMGSAAISASKSLGKLMGVLLFAVCFGVISENESESNLNHSYQYTFLFGCVIAMAGTLLAFNLKKSKITL